MKILFLADGTANGPGEVDSSGALDPTNVYKLFLRLAPQAIPNGSPPPREIESIAYDTQGQPLQIAKYIDGVGVDGNPAQVFFGQADGSGLVTRIVRGYTYLSRSYHDGDDLFLLGFSRGAYTVRALAELIVRYGLLDPKTYNPDDRVAAYKAGAAAWYAYQQTICTNAGLLGVFDKFIASLPGVFDTPPQTYVPVPRIAAIGVWDTVGSYMMTAAFDALGGGGDLFPLANTKLSKRVSRGYQAVSIDEQRDTFQSVLWDPASNVEQYLFPGAHADVGGGYSIARGEAQLADITLDWMTHRLQQHGVQIFTNTLFLHNPNPAGIAHEQWRYPPWPALGHHSRQFAGRADLLVHPAVGLRERAGTVVFDPGGPAMMMQLPKITGSYWPRNLP